MSTPVPTFEFGKNWEDFVRSRLTQERMDHSRSRLLKFLGLPHLAGCRFLDIGCGSGLSSLGAFDAQAAIVDSFDVDPQSVAATGIVRTLRSDPANWHLRQGSVLDEGFMATVEPADIVYSWGVLHHTGRMWDAIRFASTKVRPGGLFCIAIYIKTPLSAHWLQIKKRYNLSGRWGRRVMEARYIYNDLIHPNRFRPWRIPARLNDRNRDRGMSYLHDVRDWLGGYPYEDATIEEVLRFAREHLGMEWLNLRTGEACIEYLFARREDVPALAQRLGSGRPLRDPPLTPGGAA